MGRRAKSFTSAERSIHNKEKQKERRTTQHGKSISVAQRHTSYWKWHGRQGSYAICLPASLITEALQELPEATYLFQQALGNANALDETGLDVWDSGPPYTTGPPSDSTSELRHTNRLVEVMHGRCLRMLRSDTKGNRDVWKERVKKAVEQWRIAEVFMGSYHDEHREVVMAKLWKQWLARIAYHYTQKLKNM